MQRKRENWPQGVKKTQPRKKVLRVLEQAEKPISAMEICAAIEKNGETIWISTVYRILELFVQKGIVVKITIMNHETAYYELKCLQHRHYAVCLNCHQIIPMKNCPMEAFIPSIHDRDFQVLGHHLEVYGYCGNCAGKDRNPL